MRAVHSCNSWLFILFYPITLDSRRGSTDEFATTPPHLVLFSAALVELAKSIPVHYAVAYLTFKAPNTTAADDNQKYFFRENKT